ncbi:MAG: DNA (cytosine-5-)-methyltransferase [Eubacteriales bacterium]|nr:DNA (cytosine-5-)-methyltransferase [Eubacteriales bacterium]
MPYRTIDLCAGIGGIRRGFELTGEFENVLSAEVDDAACKTYEHLFGDNPKNDLTSKEFKELVAKTEYDVLLAGFPCQTFSRAGLQMGFNDNEKGIIFEHIVEIIELSHPKVLFLENVDNLVRHDEGRTFRIIIETLERRLNYKVVGVTREHDELIYTPKDFIRNSKYFGVPQNRPRTYIVAINRAYYGDATEMIKGPMPYSNDLHLYDDLRDLLEMHADIKYYMSSGYYQTLINHRARQISKGNGFGFKIVNSPEIEHPIANTILATGGSGKERNLVIDQQENVCGVEVPGKHSPTNDDCVRVMTPTEWGKLQGFINYAFVENGIDRFEFPEGMKDGQKYKQFGNSVTIPVIESMAGYILNCLTYMK